MPRVFYFLEYDNIDVYHIFFHISCFDTYLLVDDCGSSPRGEIVFVVTEPANENHRPI